MEVGKFHSYFPTYIIHIFSFVVNCGKLVVARHLTLLPIYFGACTF